MSQGGQDGEESRENEKQTTQRRSTHRRSRFGRATSELGVAAEGEGAAIFGDDSPAAMPAPFPSFFFRLFSILARWFEPLAALHGTHARATR